MTIHPGDQHLFNRVVISLTEATASETMTDKQKKLLDRAMTLVVRAEETA